MQKGHLTKSNIFYDKNTKEAMHENFFKLIKASMKNSVDSIICNGERLNTFPVIRNKTRVSTLSTSVRCCAGGSRQCEKIRKEIKCIIIKKEEA